MNRTVWFAFAAVALVATSASADIFKYTKPDGTIVYTDRMSDLPPERRSHYNRQIAEREAARKKLEQEIGKEELDRREAEAQKAELARQQLAAEERARRMAAIDARLEELQKKRAGREAAKSAWQNRMRDTKKKLDDQLERFKKAQNTYNTLSVRAGFTLLPGQAKQRTDAKKELDRLEKEIDASIQEIQVTIPEEARKQGIPPGWLR